MTFSSPHASDQPVTAEDEVVALAQDLIRIDTTNTGDSKTSAGERVAAEYVAGKLAEVGVEAQLFQSEPQRTSVVARLPGRDPSRAGLVLHGHLDVVPAIAEDWRVDPFSGEIRDGYLWGRGAIDMKNMDAMMLAIVREWARSDYRPPRDIVLAFFADEEAGGRLGARYLVENHPELFAGCTQAVGEVGGFSVSLAPDQRAYLIMTGEKGMAWTKLTARGEAGHGSMLHADNAVATIADAVSRIGQHKFPLVLTDSVRELLQRVCKLRGVDFDETHPEAAIEELGPLAKLVGATVRTTANPTMLEAGYKVNVVPGVASAAIDARIMPGQQDQFVAELDALIGPDVTREWIEYLEPNEVAFDVDLVREMHEALVAEDPGAHTVPYLLSGGTDAKILATLGIAGYGFVPQRLPEDLDFASLFHGVDERVPVEALRFGVRVLHRFLAAC